MPRKWLYTDYFKSFNNFNNNSNHEYKLIEINMKDKYIIYKHKICNTILNKSFHLFSTRKGCNNKECIRKKKEQSCLKNNKVLNPSQSEAVKEKKKKTVYKNYKVDNPAKSKIIQSRIRKTNQKNHNVNYPMQLKEIREKSRQSCLINLGVEYPSQSDKVQEKIKQKNLKNIGVEWPVLLKEVKQKSREGCKKSLGVEYPFQNKDILNICHRNTKNTLLEKYDIDCYFKAKDFLDKSKQTCLKKYNTEYPSQSDIVKKKIYKTKKKNNTFNVSEKEDLLFDILNKYFDVKRQYRDNIKYPFSCDFYLPKFDLFIEYQGNWTHGNEPFNIKNKEHLNKLEELKKRSKDINFKKEKKKYYLSAINTWTKRDIKKRNIAKLNNLKYLEIFSFKDEKDVLNQIKKIL